MALDSNVPLAANQIAADLIAINANWEAIVSDTAYGASWDTVATIAPSKNAVYDKIQTLMALTGANLAIGSDADGDMYYRASSVLARLAKGAANLKMFMNAGATAPEWASGLKIGTLTRDLTAVSGDVAYTGVGFKPAILIFISSMATYGFSIGFSNVTLNYSAFCYGTTPDYNVDGAVSLRFGDGTNSNNAVVKSMDADGFTLTWTKTASPTGTGTAYYLALR